ncbi:MAG: hypothetical protein JNN30_20460 [Rhodanobacteraceae bacterium]|nr:hypothetical protein [Rhodanobacteraceae bacterium]
MHLDDMLHRLLPVVGPLALFIAIAREYRFNHSLALLLCALSLAVTLAACVVSAWLGMRFDESHDLPDWYNQVYWWSTQWFVPLGYAVAGLSFLAFSVRNNTWRGDT